DAFCKLRASPEHEKIQREPTMIRLFSATGRMLYLTLGALALAIGLAGCAGTGSALPPAPSKAALPDYKYVIGPGDSLNIVVWRNPELSASVPVRPDGKFTSPLI